MSARRAGQPELSRQRRTRPVDLVEAIGQASYRRELGTSPRSSFAIGWLLKTGAACELGGAGLSSNGLWEGL